MLRAPRISKKGNNFQQQEHLSTSNFKTLYKQANKPLWFCTHGRVMIFNLLHNASTPHVKKPGSHLWNKQKQWNKHTCSLAEKFKLVLHLLLLHKCGPGFIRRNWNVLKKNCIHIGDINFLPNSGGSVKKTTNFWFKKQYISSIQYLYPSLLNDSKLSEGECVFKKFNRRWKNRFCFVFLWTHCIIFFVC